MSYITRSRLIALSYRSAIGKVRAEIREFDKFDICWKDTCLGVALTKYEDRHATRDAPFLARKKRAPDAAAPRKIESALCGCNAVKLMAIY